MRKLGNRNLFTIIGVIAGAIAGYFYWKFVDAVQAHAPSLPNNLTVLFTVL